MQTLILTEIPTQPRTETVVPLENRSFVDIVEKDVRATDVPSMIVALRFNNLKMLQIPNLVEKVIKRAKFN